jgi:hypothetical protein
MTLTRQLWMTMGLLLAGAGTAAAQVQERALVRVESGPVAIHG